jgi:hypothetical protein
MAQIKTTAGYILQSVIINSSRMLEPQDLVGSVTDIEIFEHMDLPYLTGQIALIDSFRLYDRLDLQGAEYCTILLKQTETSEDLIEKRFVIDKIISNKKANEQTDLLVLHLVEDILFKSNAQNVNKTYSGSPQKIIENISNEWLNKKIINITSDIFQAKLKVIIPNLSPIESMQWIKNRATTSDGFPTYLFSSFTTEDLIYADLKTMLDRQPINIASPFTYSISNSDREVTPQFRHVPIKEYKIENIENMFNLIADGLVGARHSFYSTHSARSKDYIFNVDKDAISKVLNTSVTTKEPAFANNFEIDEILLQKYRSKQISVISESGAYDDGTERFKSFDEDTTETDHAKKIVARALNKFLLKSPITIRIDGPGFIEKKAHYTTGNIVRILFLANRPMAEDVKLDLKKSGDYLIYSAKHAFSSNNYNIHLTCVKLTNFNDDNPLKVLG